MICRLDGILKLAGAVFLAVALMAIGATPKADLLRSATDPNPTLRSYTATAVLTAVLHGAIPIQKTFNGTLYYSQPNEKIVFNNVSGPLARFSKLDTRVPSYGVLVSAYAIGPVLDDGTLTTFVLVPTETGRRVQRLTLAVDDQSRLLRRAVWSYTGGGSVTAEPTYGTIGGR